MSVFNPLNWFPSSSSSSSNPIATASGSSLPSTIRQKIPKLPGIDPNKVLPFDYIPLSDAEIEHDSLLDTILPRKGLPSSDMFQKFSLAFFSHIGEITTHESITCWEWLTRETQFPSPARDHIVQEIQRLKTFHDNLEKAQKVSGKAGRHTITADSLATDFARQVHGLQHGQSRLMTGHCSGVHFIYEFTKTPEGNYTINLYSSSPNENTDTFSKGDKTRFIPFMSYENISEHNLFFNQPNPPPEANGAASSNAAAPSAPAVVPIKNDFFRRLIELDLTLVVNEETIKNTFQILEVPRVTPTNAAGAISIGGTGIVRTTSASTVRSMNVWIRKITGSGAAYRHVMFHLKFKLLIAAFNACKSTMKANDKRGSDQRERLERAARNLLRAIPKASDTTALELYTPSNYPTSSSSSSNAAETSVSGVQLDLQIARQATATAYDIIRRVHETNKAIELARKSRRYSSALQIAGLDKSALRQHTIKVHPSNKQGEIANPTKKDLPVYIQVDLNNFLSTANQLVRIADLMGNANTTGFTFNKCIDYLIDQFPIPVWPQQPPAPQIPISASSSSSAPAPIPSNAMVLISPENAFWDDLPVEMARTFSTYFVTVLRAYGFNKKMKKSYSSSASSHRSNIYRVTRTHATVLALQAIIHYLAIKIDRETYPSITGAASSSDTEAPAPMPRLEDYATLYTGLAANELDLVYLDRKEFNRIESANAYFATFNQNKRFPDTPLLTYTRSYGGIIGAVINLLGLDEAVKPITITISPATREYYTALFNALPELEADLTKRGNRKWPDLTPEKIESDYQAEVRALQAWERSNKLYQQGDKYRTAIQLYYARRNFYEQSFGQHIRYPNIFPAPKPFTEKPPQKPPAEIELAPDPGFKPDDPRYKVNIDVQEKRLRIMDQLDADIVLKYRLRHLVDLEHAMFVAREQMHQTRPSFYSNIICNRKSDYCTEWMYTCVHPTETLEREQVQRYIMQFDDLNQEGIAFLKLEQTKRKTVARDRGTAEARALEKEIANPFLKRLLRAVSESDLSPYQLIYEAKQDLEEFSSASMRSLFFRLFFRSTVTTKNNAKLGAGELIITDNDALFELSHGFISQGLAHYMKKKEATDDPVNGGNFFFELAFYLSRYLKDGNKPTRAAQLCQLETIEQWLQLTNVNAAGKADLHALRILFFSISSKPFTDEDYAKIYESWILFGPRHRDETHSTDSMKCIGDFMKKTTMEMENRFREDPALLNSVCNKIITSIGVSNSETANVASTSSSTSAPPVLWTSVTEEDNSFFFSKVVNNYPLITCNNHPSGRHQINLATGEVHTPQGLFSAPDNESYWLTDADFIMIFGRDTDFNYKSLGYGTVSFTHPDIEGLFKITTRDDETPLIQRQFPGSEMWFEHKPIRGLQHWIPTALEYDHTFWEVSGNYGIQGYFTSLHTQERKFVLQLDGTILEVDSTTGQPTPNSRRIENDNTGFYFFDHNVLVYQKEPHTIDRIQFTRYQSLDQNPLAFVDNKKGLMVWTENAQYALPQEMPQGYLGDIPNYLFLQPLDQKLPPKILVPFQRLAGNGLATNNLVPLALTKNEAKKVVKKSEAEKKAAEKKAKKLKEKKMADAAASARDLADKAAGSSGVGKMLQNMMNAAKEGGIEGLFSQLMSQAPDKEAVNAAAEARLAEERKFQAQQWGQHQYFVYDVEGVNLKPTSQEAQLFLAYLHMTQRKSKEAIELLSQITGEDKLSDASMKILSMMQSHHYVDNMASPNDKMVILHAALQMMKEKDRRSSEEVKAYFTGDDDAMNHCKFMLEACLQSLNNVSIEHRFSVEDELYFLTRFAKEIETSNWDKSFLTKITNRANFLAGVSSNHMMEVVEIPNLLNKAKKVATALIKINKLKASATPFPLPDRSKIKKKKWDPTAISVDGIGLGAEVNKTAEEIEEEFQQQLSNFIDEQVDSANSIFDTSYKAGVMPDDTSYKTGVMPDYATGLRFFLNILRIAKTESLSDRNTLLFWIKLWRLSNDTPAEAIERLDLLTVVLLNPRAFSMPIDIQIRDKEPWVEFMKAVNQEYRNVAIGYIDYYTDNNLFNPSNMLSLVTQQKVSSEAKIDQMHYPITGVSAFDLRKEEPLSERTVAIEMSLNPLDDRWKQLDVWKSRYLDPIDPPLQPSFPVSYDHKEGMLSANDIENKDSLINALKEAQLEHESGRTKNEAATTYTITPENCQLLRTEVTAEIAKAAEQLHEAEKVLLDHMNKEPVDARAQLLERAKLGGKVKKRLTFKDAVSALLSLDYRVYTRKNPVLTDAEVITAIAHETMAVCDMKSRMEQLKRIQTLVTRLETNHISELERGHLLLKLEEELAARYHFGTFNDETQVAFRIFSSETGKIPFQQQTEIIHDMLEVKESDPNCFKDIVIQLIMGGGKTSVIATIQMYLSARKKDRIALFIVPAPLFNVVKTNLGSSLKESFDVGLEQIDLTRSEMTTHKLRGVRDLLQKARAECLPLITKATTLQALDLESKSQALTFKNCFHQQKDIDRDLPRKKAELAQKKREFKKASALGQEGTLQQIQMLTEQIKRIENDTKTAQATLVEAREKLFILNDISKLLRNNTDALVDEVDQVLNALQEMNFPIGNKIPLTEEGNTLLRNIYQALVNTQLMAKPSRNSTSSKEAAISVDALVNLTRQDRTIIDETVYRERVAPAIAEHLANTYAPFADYIDEHKGAFIRYLSNEIPVFIEQYVDLEVEELTEAFLDENLDPEKFLWRTNPLSTLHADLRFIKHLKALYHSDHADVETAANDKTAAQMIALARGLLHVLTPATLKKSGNRDYGLKPGTAGKTVPFLGVNTPATTEFGYHWEEACYYYQYAAAFAPTELEILTLAKKCHKAAKVSVQLSGIPYEKTTEYRYFLDLFDVPMKKIKEKGNLQKAIARVCSNINARLELQYENVAQNVTYYPARLNSTGANLMCQLASRRTMSGTPWNVEGYLESLLERYKPDMGTEGRVFDAMAKKTSPEKIITISLDSVTAFLDSAFRKIPQEDHERVTGITEVGALFKKFPKNEMVAKEIMEYLASKPSHSHVEGVLFFYREGEDSSDDTLYVWKKGATTPEKVGGSSLEALKAKNLSPDNYFTYYAERNTTGTDIPQVPNGITLFTFDEMITTRNTAQALMRYRQYLTSQDAYILMTPESKQYIFNEGTTVNDLIIQGIIVQTIKKSNHMDRHFTQMVRNIFRMVAGKNMFSTIDIAAAAAENEAAFNRSGASSSEAQSTVGRFDQRIVQDIERYEQFIVQEMADEPYLQFGPLKDKVDTRTSLISHLDRTLDQFLSSLPHTDETSRAEIIALADQLRGQIAAAKSLPQFREEAPPNLGMQMEEELLIAVEVHVETDNLIEEEIELNMQLYRQEGHTSDRKERKMDLTTFNGLLDSLLGVSSSTAPALISTKAIRLSEQLKKYQYGSSRDRIPFHEAFSPQIYGTYSYFHACRALLSVFEEKQRPPKQILAMRMDDGSFRWLLLSEMEFHYAKRHLNTLYGQNDPRVTSRAWLIQPDGTELMIHDNCDRFPMITHENAGENVDVTTHPITEGLMEINAFGGNMVYINRHPTSTEHWLETQTELKIHYLRVKTSLDPEQSWLFKASTIVAGRDITRKMAPITGLDKKRLEDAKSHQGQFKPLNIVAAKLLTSASRIGELNCEWVQHLGIDLAKEHEPDTRVAIDKISEFANDSKQAVDDHNRSQFAALRPYHGPHIKPEQVKWVPREQTKILTEKTQFCVFDANDQIIDYLLTWEQVQGLERKTQSRLIPFVNPDFYPDFTEEWQIQNVPLVHLRAVNKEYYDLLSDKQIHAIRDPHFIHDWINDADYPLDESKYRLIHGNMCHLIPPASLRHITPTQIAEISEPERVRNLVELEVRAEVEPGTFSRHIGRNMVPIINPANQLRYLLTAPQISNVPNEWVPNLDIVTQVPHIESQQVNALTTEQLHHCPNKLLQCLDASRVCELLNHQLPYLRGRDQVRAVNTAERFALLCGVETGIIPNHMCWISADQYPFIQEHQVPGLHKDQLLEISLTQAALWERIKNLITPRQIASFDTQPLIDLLSDDQIESCLVVSQVGFLKTTSQILSCPMHLVEWTTPEQAQKVSPAKIAGLKKKSQIEKVPNKLIKHLTVAQIRNVGNGKLRFVPNDKSAGFTKSQLDMIRTELPIKWAAIRPQTTREQAVTFDTQTYFDMLLPAQINQFAIEAQVPFMRTQEQVRACPDPLVHCLSPAQVAMIAAPQVPHLVGPEQHAALPIGDDYFENVNVTQYPYLPLPLKDRLTVEKIVNYEGAVPGGIVGISLQFLREPANNTYATTVANPVNLVKHLAAEQFSQFADTDADGNLAGRLTTEQVGQIQGGHVNLLGRLNPAQVPQLSNPALAGIPVNRKPLLKNVPNNRIHNLSLDQIKGRDLSWWMPKVCYRIVGCVRTVFIPLTLVVQLVIDVVKIVFATIRVCWNRSTENKARIWRQLKKTFYWNPKITLIAPVQIWRPEKYWQMRSRYTAAAEA